VKIGRSVAPRNKPERDKKSAYSYVISYADPTKSITANFNTLSVLADIINCDKSVGGIFKAFD
jgi:hypothetical protein